MAGILTKLAEPHAAFAGVFRNPGLRRLALAYTGSEIGAWGYSIALMVLVFESGGAAGLGLVTLVLMLAPGIAAPFTSLLGDRYDRVRVMLVSDLVRVGLMAAAAAVAFAGAPTGLLYAIAALSSIAGTAFRPAQAALVPSLARTPDELTAANVVNSTIESVTAFAGPALGGVVVALADPGVSFAIAAGTFLWSAALIARVPRAAPADGEPEPEQPAGVVRQLGLGLRTVAGEPRVRLLVLFIGAQTLIAGTLLVFLPVLALGELGSGEEGLGALNSALGVGGVVGAAATVGLVGRRRLSRPLALGTILWGVPIALVALWDTQLGALVLFGLVGFANTIVDVSSYTLLQRAVPDRVLARVFGILESVIYATHAVGGVVAAILVETAGITTALVATGLVLPVVVLAGWSALARLDADAPPPTEQLALLRQVPFLAILPPATLESLAAHAESAHAAAGEQVFTQGEPGDRFYIIGSGEAAVILDGEPARTLAAGGWFGEIALLRDVPRTATVTALTDLELLAIERDEFLAAVTGHAPSAEAAGAIVESRLSRSAVAPLT